MTVVDKPQTQASPLTVRLDDELRDRLNQYVHLKGLVGESTNASDVVRTALSAYLDGFMDCLREEVKKNL